MSNKSVSEAPTFSTIYDACESKNAQGKFEIDYEKFERLFAAEKDKRYLATKGDKTYLIQNPALIAYQSWKKVKIIKAPIRELLEDGLQTTKKGKSSKYWDNF